MSTVLEFQVARNVYEKESYDTIYAEDLIDSIKSLKVQGNPAATPNAISSLFGSNSCFISQAKKFNPYMFPYSMKDAGSKLVKENTKEFTMLVLDIDNGSTGSKCSMEEFIAKYTEFDYYLYTTAGHACSVHDRYRVVVPLTEPMEVEELILRKKAIEKYFSFGGFSFVDTSAINRCRGFVVPVVIGDFYECTHRVGKQLNVEGFDRVRKAIRHVSGNRTEIPGIEKHPEVLALAEQYIDSGKDQIINVGGKEYGRNDAFFFIHVKIASYNITFAAQMELAHLMNWDGVRGESVESVVTNARDFCTDVAVSALAWGSKRDGVTIVKDYISKDMVPLEYRKVNLLTSPPGTGKTTIALGKDLPVIGGVTHRVLFAAPLNIIGEQNASKDAGIIEVTGRSGVLPDADRLSCSFDALVAILERNPDIEDYLIVIDECHKIFSSFRSTVMSEILEHTIKNSKCTFLYMSGTFDPIFLECIDFATHFRFGTERPFRDINVVEVDCLIQGTTQLLKKLRGNTLTLLDDTKKGEHIAKVVGGVQVSGDKKEEPAYKDIALNEKIEGHVITTQVIMEGVNINNCVDHIIIVGKPQRWGVDEMVQFYERERIKTPKFYFIRKAIEEREVFIKHAKTEKEYQNRAFQIMKDQGLNRLRDIKVINTKGLFTEAKDSFGMDSVVMNIAYPYAEQKTAFNTAVFQDPELMNTHMKTHRYRLVSREIEGVNAPEQAIQTLIQEKKDLDAEEYEKLVVESIKGIEPENPDDHKVFMLARNLLEVQHMDALEVYDILHNPKKKLAYWGRIRYGKACDEKAMFAMFKEGASYSKDQIKGMVIKAFNAAWSKDLRVANNAELQLLSRYFETKYSRAKKTHKLVKKIHIEIAESYSDI
jgi:hypothetical protein